MKNLRPSGGRMNRQTPAKPSFGMEPTWGQVHCQDRGECRGQRRRGRFLLLAVVRRTAAGEWPGIHRRGRRVSARPLRSRSPFFPIGSATDPNKAEASFILVLIIFRLPERRETFRFFAACRIAGFSARHPGPFPTIFPRQAGDRRRKPLLPPAAFPAAAAAPARRSRPGRSSARMPPAASSVLCRDGEAVFEIADRLADMGREPAVGNLPIGCMRIATSGRTAAADADAGGGFGACAAGSVRSSPVCRSTASFCFRQCLLQLLQPRRLLSLAAAGSAFEKPLTAFSYVSVVFPVEPGTSFGAVRRSEAGHRPCTRPTGNASAFRAVGQGIGDRRATERIFRLPGDSSGILQALRNVVFRVFPPRERHIIRKIFRAGNGQVTELAVKPARIRCCIAPPLRDIVQNRESDTCKQVSRSLQPARSPHRIPAFSGSGRFRIPM